VQAYSQHILLTSSFRPSATSGEPAEAAEDNIHTREDDSRPHSPASDKESSEAQKRDTATSRSNDQSSNVEKEPEATSKHEKVIENESPNNQNVYRPYGYRRRIRVPRGDPWDVEWRSSITKYEHRPSNFRQREISPDKRKLDMLMYRADQLRHQRYVTPIQRIETLAPSYPDRLPPLIPPAFTGHEPPSVQHPMAVTEPERRCLPPHMSPVFTGQSPAPSEGLWTDGKSKVKVCLRRTTLTHCYCNTQSGTDGRCTGESDR
jgi:hypothetical protein